MCVGLNTHCLHTAHVSDRTRRSIEHAACAAILSGSAFRSPACTIVLILIQTRGSTRHAQSFRTPGTARSADARAPPDTNNLQSPRLACVLYMHVAYVRCVHFSPVTTRTRRSSVLAVSAVADRGGTLAALVSSVPPAPRSSRGRRRGDAHAGPEFDRKRNLVRTGSRSRADWQGGPGNAGLAGSRRCGSRRTPRTAYDSWTLAAVTVSLTLPTSAAVA